MRSGSRTSGWLPRLARWSSYRGLIQTLRVLSPFYVPLTTQNRMSRYEVALPKLPFLDRDSFANVQGLGSIATVRLERKLGRLPGTVMKELKAALKFALGLE